MSKRNTRRRVRFELTDYGDVRTYQYESPHARSELIDESLWWSPGEYTSIRSSVMLLTSKVRNGDDEDEFSTMRKNSYQKSLSKAYRLSLKSAELPKNARDDLAFWVSLADSRRGLEKFILEDMRRDRDKRRDKLINAVRVAQDRSGDRGFSLDHRMDTLRSVSLGASKHAARFAQTMGAADASAVSIQLHTTPRYGEERSKLTGTSGRD